jgi:hypothetical protein
MAKTGFTIQAPEGSREVFLTTDRLTIGRGPGVDVAIDDSSLSAIHCSIHRQDDKLWILDENSEAGSFVNGEPVAALGTPLSPGDEITLGAYISVRVNLPGGQARPTPEASSPSPFLLFAGSLLLVLAVVAIGGFAAHLLRRESRVNSLTGERPGTATGELPAPPGEAARGAADSPGPAPEARNSGEVSTNANLPIEAFAAPQKSAASRRSYLRMSPEEQNEFIYAQARNVSRMMSNREYVFTDEVLPYIKKYVDGYARRVGNQSTAIWGEDLHFLFARARRLAPDIIREFNARGTPKVVGLYIPMIESEYRECLTSPVGAKGLFQFMPATARGYGVDPEDRCNVKRMAPAAARYIKDRIAEFGSDAMSVALGIAGYNRSPDSVRRDLSDVLDSRNKERSFWTLIANSEKLDHYFQNENVKYVPKFFAAAIVGENPWAFGLDMNPLSTYSGMGESED